MKTLLLKIENWLFIGPLLLCFFSYAFVGESVVDFHVRDTYIVIGQGNIMNMLLWLSIFAIPILLHRSMRKKNGGNSKFSNAHVIISLLLMVFISLPATELHPMPRRYYEYAVWGSIGNYTSTYCYQVISLLLLLLWQVVFVVYGIVVLAKRNKVLNL